MPINPTDLATMVQLLAIFWHEKGSRNDLRHREFMDWLESHRHQEIKDLISQTHHLSEELDKILQQDQKLILAKIADVSNLLGDIFSRIDGLNGLRRTLPKHGLSDQAIEILQIFARSGATEMFMSPRVGEGMVIQLMPDKILSNLDQRIIHDDLASLVDVGFLSQFSASPFQGHRLTRAGVRFVDVDADSS